LPSKKRSAKVKASTSKKPSTISKPSTSDEPLTRERGNRSVGFDRIIKGGNVVTPAGSFLGDVGITGEKITALGVNLEGDRSTKVIDAKGHHVIPGVLDVHVHLELPFMGTVSADDYRTGTRAGARGGVTTLIDFAIPYAGESLSDAADNWMRRAEGKSLIDYTFHICITRWNEHKDQIKGMVDRGFTTFKEFMIYESEGWQSDDRAMFGTLEKMKEYGTMLLVHAESARVLDELIARHHTPELMKKYGARLHPMTRPNFIEAEAIQRAVQWCEATGGQLYIVHMSTGEGTDIIKAAQARGVPVLAETCVQYLVLDDSVFEREDGHLFACCPQLKKPKDVQRLWKGLKTGEVAVISTDTCTFDREQKAMWKGDWTKIPMGMPGLETLMPLTYTRGVLEGKITLEEMCTKLSTNPAKIMGLYPRKGAIQVGADADIAIIHPKKTHRVDPDSMETNADWSPYEGWDLAGFSRTTLSRGDVIVDDYQVVGKEGRGQWLPRKTAGLAP
jgi:dihydropyrimidinase